MKCKKCGKDLPESAKFCLECGEKVERELVCPSCGTILPPDAKFCLECGASTVKSAEEDKEDAGLTDEPVERGSDDDGIDWGDETYLDDSEVDWDAIYREMDQTERKQNIIQTYFEEHSELKWVSQADNLSFYGISNVGGNEILQRYYIERDGIEVSPIPAENFQLFRIVQGERVEVRILAEFEDDIMLFDYDGRKLEEIIGTFEDKRRLYMDHGDMYYGWKEDEGGQGSAGFLNLITGKFVELKYVDKYEWGFFSKNGRILIRFTTYTQEGKRTGSLMWDDGWDGFHTIPVKEWAEMGGFPKVGSRPEQLEAQGYLRLNVSVDELTLERYQALSELQRSSSVNTEEEVGQFIRNYLQIIGSKELKDLGDGYYYLRINNTKSYIWGQYVYEILDLNAVGNFINRDNKNGFWHLYDYLYNESMVEFLLKTGKILHYCRNVAFDWISKPVDGKIYCLIPTYEGGGYNVFSDKHERLPIRKKYKELYIHAMNGEESGEKEADIKVLSYKSGEKRILINLHQEEDAAFFIFDLEGNLILKKEGHFSQAASFFGYRVLDDEDNCRYTGLYDEITGRELLPCQYHGVRAWRKKAGRGGHYENGEILLGGIQLKVSGSDIGYKIEYFRYNPQSGEVSALTDMQTFPLDHVMNFDECAKLGYESWDSADDVTTFSESITLDSLDPEVAEEDRKKM